MKVQTAFQCISQSIVTVFLDKKGDFIRIVIGKEKRGGSRMKVQHFPIAFPNQLFFQNPKKGGVECPTKAGRCRGEGKKKIIFRAKARKGENK